MLPISHRLLIDCYGSSCYSSERPARLASPDIAPLPTFNAECTYEPLAAVNEDVMNVGSATMSVITCTCKFESDQLGKDAI